MTALRRNRTWLAVALLLAVVFATGGLPARASACGAGAAKRPTASVTEPSAAGRCAAMLDESACCCAPGHAAESEGGSGFRLDAAGNCGCTLSAPPAGVPAADRAAGSVQPVVSGLPSTAAAFEAGPCPAWGVPAATSFRRPARSLAAGPSRAPPAC
jgi:hypothetical protein